MQNTRTYFKIKKTTHIICITLITLLMVSAPLAFENDMYVYGASKKVKVTYKANGGNFTSKKYINKKSFSKKKKRNKRLGTLPGVKRNEYKLKGWYTKKSGGRKVSKKTKIKKKTTLYARWVKIQKPKNLPYSAGFKISPSSSLYHLSMYIDLYCSKAENDGPNLNNISKFKCYYRPIGDAKFKSINIARDTGILHSGHLEKMDPTVTYEVYATGVDKNSVEFVRTEMANFKIGNNLRIPVITGANSCNCCTSFYPQFELYRDVTHYQVYASETKDGPYKWALIYTLANQHIQIDPFFGIPKGWKGNFMTYNVGVMKPGKSYYIKMRSVYESKKTGKRAYSKFSEPYKFKLNFKSFPPTKGVKVTDKKTNSAKVSWKEYKGPDTYGYHYKIYLKKGKKGKYKCVKTIKRYSYVTSYTLKKLKKNTRYTVYMVALNSFGDKSQKSKRVTFRTKKS